MKLFVLALAMCFGQISYSQGFQDCKNSFPICEFGTYHFSNMQGVGEELDNLPEMRCISNTIFHETNSKWLSFTVAESGMITFTITPKDIDNDIDFILFKSNHGNCTELIDVRCMVSGNNISFSSRSDDGCQGETGLSFESVEEFERSGCAEGSDNFIKYIYGNKDEKYYLLINNYDSKQGFSISFEGGAEFLVSNECNSDMVLSTKEETVSILKVFPNPAASTLNVICDSKKDKLKYIVKDFSGRTYKSDKLTVGKGSVQFSINTSSLAQGAYLLKIIQGSRVTSRSFIKF